MAKLSSLIFAGLTLVLIATTQTVYGQNCSVNAGTNQTICADQALGLTGIKAGLAPNPTTWSQVLGTPATISTPNALNTAITGFGVGNYRFRLTTTCQDGVTVFDDVDITIIPAISLNAGPDVTKCKQTAPIGTAITLAGQALIGGQTGVWTVVSGTSGAFSNVNSPTSTFTVTAGNVCTNTTTSTLRWTVANGTCTKADDAIITFIGGDPVNAGPDQTANCGTAVTLAASCPGANPQAGQWTTVSGPTTPTFSNAASPTAVATNLIVGTYVLRWTVNGACVSGFDDMTITVNSIATPTISAGSNQTVTCGSNATLGGTTFVAPQQAQWSVVSGPGGGFFNNPNVSNPTISGLQLGTYTLQYTIFGPCFTATANVTLTVNSNVPATTANAGSNLNYCQGAIPAPIGLSGNVPNTGETGLWTQTAGTTVTINTPTSPNATVSGISAAGTYTFRWTISRGACTSQNSMSITITTAPTVSAGADQTLACNATTATLNGTPAGGNWNFVSGPATPVVSGSNVTAMSTGGTYIFQYSLSTGCGTISDVVNIFVSKTPVLTNAGTDQNLACNVISTFLAGNTPTGGGTGTWSVLNGPNVPTIANVNLNTTGVTNLVPGVYNFRWTINNGFTCPPNFDDVKVVSISGTPTTANAGIDKTVCYGTPATMTGNTPANNETGTWTKISGPAGSVITNGNNPTTTITGLIASSTYTFRWTIANACGSTFDEVIVSTTNTQGPTIPNAGIDKCVAVNTVAMTGNAPTTGTGLWSQVSGPSATITTPASPTTNINLTGGNAIYQFVWTISGATCASLKDTVVVTFGGVPTTANAGADQSVCDYVATLAGNTPTVGTGLWTMTAGNGGAVITTPTSPTSGITGLTPGFYTFRWTITNGTCGNSFDDVNLQISQPPSPANAGADVAGCGTAAFALAAIVPAVGAGVWSVVSGNATFSNVNSATSTVTPTTPVTVVRWTVTGGPGCAATFDEATVTTVPTANAGSSQSVCNAATINLNASSAGAGSGAWSQTAGAATTIATPSNNATSVSGLAAPGTYTYRWDVTGGGCSATNSSLTITNSAIPTTPDAGPDQTVCPSPSVASVTMAANTPALGTGAWTKISGPACTITTPSSPTTTITSMGAGAYKFRWTISNGACTSLIDEVDIFVPAITIANAGADQTLCMYNTVATLGGNSPTSGVGTWTMISGPNTPNIVLPNIYNTQVTGMIPGAYNFQWQIVNSPCSSTDAALVTIQSSVPATPTVSAVNATICSLPGTYNLTTIQSAPSTAGGVMEWHVANSYTSPLVGTPTAVGAGNYFLFERNTSGCYSNSASFTLFTQDCGIYGNVYDDANGLTNSIVDGTPTNIGGALYANLVNAAGNVVGIMPIAADGSYGFPSVIGNASYTVVLSIIYGTIGSPVAALLPNDWVNTGENIGTAAGNDGTVNGRLAVSITTTNVYNVNFGIEQRPIPTGITLPSVVNPTGTNQITINPNNFTGTDGDNTITQVHYTTFPTGVTSITIGGTLYTSFPMGGITVPIGTTVSIDPVNGAGNAVIPFTLIDNLGVESFAPANVIQPFTDLTISGTVYDDANGLTNNLVDGTTVFNPSGVQLYANLVNGAGNVVGVVPVASNGTYTIGTLNGVLANTNYTVVLSTIQGIEGTPVSSVLPANWVNTGEGIAAAGDGTVNGITAVSVVTTNVTGVNFGIEQLPNSNTPATTTQVNPTGTTQVQAVTLTGTDPENGALGTGNSVQITTLPTNATLYYNGVAVIVGQVITSYNPALLTLDPTFIGAGTSTFNFAFIDAAGNADPTPATATMIFTDLTISGTVFDDANGLINSIVDGTGTGLPSGTQLYANLVSGGNVVGSVLVAANGTYTLAEANGVVPNSSFQVIISTTQGTIGSPVSAVLPSNWVNTGENIGTGAGNDGTVNGILAVNTVITNIPNVNFGIEQLPNSNTPATTTQTNPGGTTQVQALTLTGSDPENGALGTGNSVQITTLPTNATLYYNGIAVTAGQVITSYNPALLTLDPTFLGAGTVTFDFAFIDAAGKTDPTPATATMIFTDISISGTVFDDANGLNNSIVDGTGTGLPSGTQLYANLVNGAGNVVGSVAVAANGTYTLTGANGIQTNTSYTVVVSTTQGTVGSPVSAVLPSNWVNTGENIGTGAGNDGTVNGILAVNVGTINIPNVNFGIDQLPNSNTPTTTTQTNPGGTTQVQAVTLTGSDPEDGALGTTNSVQITTLPTNATLYYNGIAVTAGQVITNYNPALLTLDPTFLGAGTVTFNFAFIDAAGKTDPTPATATMIFTDISISGTVFDDANGLNNNIVDGTGTGLPSGTQLYANLVNGAGNVVGSVAVAANGTYTLTGANGIQTNTGYTVVVSTTQGTVGSPVASILPSNWVNTGENIGTGAGNDGTVNGSLAVSVVTTNIPNVNFGIDQLPNSNTPTTTTQTNPGGTTQVQALTLTGSDPEDGALGTTNSVQITTLPTNATLYYNGIAVTAGQVITNYNPALLTLDPTFLGAGTVTFEFAFVDAAGKIDPTPATATMIFTDISISGTVFDDANGLNNSIVDGTGTGLPSGTQLYANLVDGTGNVVGSVAVAANGTYTLTGANGIQINTSYTVVVSTTQGTVGSPVAAILPSNWVNTGENIGTGAGNDGTVNGSLAVSVGTSNIPNVNFGIDQLPNSNTPATTTQTNPGGTTQVQAVTLTGSDPEDGALGTSNSVQITTLPTNATLYYNGIAVTAGQTITNYDPALLTLDPTFVGAGTVTFEFAFIDAAGNPDPSPATATMIFSDISISGTVFDDANGLNNSTVDGTGTGLPSGAQLYANLVDGAGNVVGSVAVAANGTYTLTGANGIQTNTSYTVVVSTTQGTVGSPVSAVLPSNWVNTGENIGTGAGNDGTVNGILAVNVGTINIPNVNFGIDQLPNSNTPTTTTQTNPGGTTQVQAVTLMGSDPEDGALGTSNSVQITTLPTNATLYYNGIAVIVGQIITNYDPALLTLDPTFLGAGTVTFEFAFIDAAGNPDPTPATATMIFSDISISGTVFDDANGLNNSTVDGTGTGLPSGAQLYANLVDGTGNVVGSVAVAANGTYTLTGANGIEINTSYKVIISTTQGTVGSPLSTVLPTNWVNTGENIGTGAGNDGTVNGSIAVSVGTINIPNVNFGIEQLPNSNTPTTTTQTNPGGTTQVQAVTLTGSDPEDGALGTSNSVQITTLPTNATLYYNGIAVIVGQIITNYDPALLTLDPTFLGAGTVTFEFAFIDAAGNPDPTPATATMIFSDISISGTVFDDANGLNNSTVDGTGTGLPSGAQLYANLVDGAGNVVGSVAVAANGTYTLTGANGIEINTSYTVVVSATQGTVGSPVATILPSNWVNTGENIGTGAGNDGTVNGILAVSVGTTNISNVNFGIEQLPNSNTPTTTTQTNPGGTTQVQAVTLTGSDPEDGALGTSNSVQITTLPTNATLYYNGIAVTAGQIITNYDPALLTLDPTFVGAGTVTFEFAFVDAAGKIDPTPATATMIFTDISISGTVFDDANGLNNSIVDGTGTGLPSGTQLYANLVDGTGNVVGSVAVAANGSYTLTGANGIEINTSYTVVVSTTQGTVGSPVASVLPTNWVNTGENIGTGAGDDGTVNGSLAVSVGTSNISNVNFGIEQLPNTNTPATTTQTNPGGTTQVQAVTLTGSDPEDGALGTSNSVQITTLPTNATLYYNGIAVTAGQTITNYDPALLTLDPTFVGAGTVTFEFAFIDAAGNPDPSPATATMIFSDISISGTVFDDADGLNNSIVDGTGTGLPSGTQLYANLVDGAGNVVGSVAVAANGTYTLTGANGIEINTSYTVVVSTTQGTVGSPVASILPTNWVNTGENIGTGAGDDGTVNGSLAVSVGTSSVSNVNFGIEQLPNSLTPTTTTQANPGGTTQVQAVTLTGNDPEDGALGTGNSVQITTLPTNATLYYNGIAVTAGQVITNYDPALLTLDPTFVGAGTVTFDFAFVDAAGNPDPTPATATMIFTDLSISGTVFDDANGLNNNTVDGIGTGLPSGTQLYANLVDGAGNVVGSVAVNANGTYTLTSANGVQTNTGYDIIISTLQGTVGSPVASVLPTNWVNTGENEGATAGDDGLVNGSLGITVGTSNVTEVNFGIEQLPNTNTPATTTQVNPGGSTQVQAPTLTGTDPEDGALGTSNTLQIITLPNNATLYYDGVAVIAGQIIMNYNPALLTLDPTFLGAGSVAFDFVFIDAAGNPDPTPATATLIFTDISISGTVFDDADGLTNTTVDGIGTGLPSGTQLYANLVDGAGNVVGSVAVNANGTYTLTGANGLEINTNYTLVISTTQGTVGSPVATVLPTNWVNTGENLGASSGNDGTINGSLAVNVGTSNVTDLNFGIEQLPIPYNGAETSQYNPGGTLTVNVAAGLFTATDADGTVASILITAFPSNATTITIDGVVFTASTFPLLGVSIPVNASGNPTQTITIDPIDGAVTVTIPYIVIDNAGQPSTTTAIVSLPFVGYANTTIAIDDDNNTYMNTPVSGGVITNDFDAEGNTQTFGGFDDPATPGVDYATTGTFTTIPGTDANGNPVADAGNLLINSDGSYTFTPSTGFVGVVILTYQVCDNGMPIACQTATLTIDVAPMPDPLDGNNNDVIANNDENVSYGQPVSDNVLNNDNDPNGNDITFGGFINPNNGSVVTSGTITNVPGVTFDGTPVANAGTLVINPDGSYTFTPTPGFFGTIEIPYTITDNAPTPATDTAILTIIVLPDANGNLNNAPFAGDDFGVTLVGVPTTGSFIDNDNDPNGDQVSVNGVLIDTSVPTTTIGSYPTANGTIVLYSNGTYLYTPNPGFVGNDQYVYQICDVTSINPQPLCTEATIYFTVANMLQDFGDLPISFGIARNLITTNIVNGVPTPMPTFWIGNQIDGEIETQGNTAANGDDSNNANGSTGDEDGLIIPDTVAAGYSFNFEIALNSLTPNMPVYYGFWIDWDNDGTFETFYTGSVLTNGLTTVNQLVSVPGTYNGGNINMRLRAFASAPTAANFQGVFNNGETEDFVKMIALTTFPVELTDFKAMWRNNDGLVEWTTQVEINSDYFEVQRSLDNGQFFEEVGKVDAAGNTSSARKYQFTDKEVALLNVHKIYYRLKMVDIDGKFTYSDKAELTSASEANIYLNAYPNPTKGVINIDFFIGRGKEVEIRIINALGQEVYSDLLDNQNTAQQDLSFDFRDFAAGTYILQLNTNTQVLSKKIVVE